MALVTKDRVKETTTTTGTGTVTLGGAVSGFQSFSAIGDGNTTYYAIVLATAGEWEIGLGTYTASGTTLSRDTVLESSNAGSLVNFSSGSKQVFCTYPAEKAAFSDDIPTNNNELTNGAGYITGNQTITLSGDATGSGTTSISVSLAADSVGASEIAANAVGASELNVTGNGTASQFLRSDGDGTFTWATPTDTNTTYTAGTGLSLSGTTFSNSAPDQTVTLTGSGATTISGTYPNFTISSTDTNTTYSAGTNISLSGTTFNVDDAFVLNTGDTMTGDLYVGSSAGGSSRGLKIDTNGEIQQAATDGSWLHLQRYGGNRVVVGGTDAADLYVGSSEVWHAGNDGTGSGLDADTVDGIQASSFLRSDADDTFTGTLSFSTYGDTIVRSGGNGSSDTTLWRCNANATTNDSADYGFSIKYMGSRSGNENSYSIFSDNSTGSQVEAFTIKQDGTLWQGLTNKIWHAGNDGSGSGLDADTVDGLEAYDFLRSNADDQVSANLTWGDNRKAIFGSGGTGLEIYRTSSESVIADTDTGPLTIRASAIYFHNQAGTETHASFIEDNGCRLYYDNSAKFETTSTGASITGDLTVSGGDITLGGTGRIQGIDTVSASTDAASKGYVDTQISGLGATTFPFYKEDGSSDTIAITNGSFPFYKADGTQDNIGVS